MDEELQSVHSEENVNKTESARDDWRPYHGDLIAKLLLEKVRDATASQSMQKLEEAIAACDQHNLEGQKDVMHGKQRLQVITARYNLKEAVKSGNTLHIRSEILKIQKNKNLKKELQQDIIEAEQFISELDRRGRTSEKILGLNRKTLTEIRRCFNPPVTMKRTLQASLLLLGEDEETTQEWIPCLRFLNPQGKSGMIKRILDFDRTKIHPEVSCRAKEILTKSYDVKTKKELTEEEVEKMKTEYTRKYVFFMDLQSVRQASPAAAAFYVWSMGVIDECESRYEDEPTPASVKRQKYLLRKPTLTPADQKVTVPSIRKRYVYDSDAYLQKDWDYVK